VNRRVALEVGADLCVLIRLIAVACMLWIRRQNARLFEQYELIKKNYGSVLNNFIDQFGPAKAKDAAFTYQ